MNMNRNKIKQRLLNWSIAAMMAGDRYLTDFFWNEFSQFKE